MKGFCVKKPSKGGKENIQPRLYQSGHLDIHNIGGAFDGIEEIIRRRLGANILGFGQDKVSKSKENSVIHLIESSDLVHYGIIPELIGRLHVVATLEPITLEDMVRILLEPKNSIVKQYPKLFELDKGNNIF